MSKISEEIGSVIRENRKKLGLSQKNIGNKIGMSYQQIQKYEYGTSEITVSKLYQLAEVLEVSPYLFLKNINNSMIIKSEGRKKRKRS